jgi:hypothetical protein
MRLSLRAAFQVSAMWRHKLEWIHLFRRKIIFQSESFLILSDGTDLNLRACASHDQHSSALVCTLASDPHVVHCQ